VTLRKALLRAGAALLSLCVLAAALVAWLNSRDEAPLTNEQVEITPAVIKRGEYLARVGNCMGCHSAPGAAPLAGGIAIATPFGTVYSSNLTPDVSAGLGSWTAAQFWRAMHNGRSKDGRLLTPAFPYTNYTQISRADSDALFAYLQSQPASATPNRAHELRWPYSTQAALAVWRALYFKPGEFTALQGASAELNRGAYLVRGLGHCSACHASRDALGGFSQTQAVALSGGLIPPQNWYAPSLASSSEASVAEWPVAQIVQLLTTGTSAKATVSGPMAEVVTSSTQHLNPADAQAMAVYLKSIPQTAAPSPAPSFSRDAAQMVLGGKVYEQHCAQCHGKAGEGKQESGNNAVAYPALAGNRAVLMDAGAGTTAAAAVANLLRIVLEGGYAPATAANPRPYGMPPFAHVLSDAELAAVTSYIRGTWGNNAAPVTQLQALQQREGRVK
jgi:mono/diheme cytochrome c family protein